MPIFLVVFAIYRSIFASLKGHQQVAVAPVFMLMKLTFREAAMRLISKGGNADAAPCLAFCFDVIFGTTANFLVCELRSNSQHAHAAVLTSRLRMCARAVHRCRRFTSGDRHHWSRLDREHRSRVVVQSCHQRRV
jgi:hypothetical protein